MLKYLIFAVFATALFVLIAIAAGFGIWLVSVLRGELRSIKEEEGSQKPQADKR